MYFQYSSTALILATRGNYIDVVELLLSREPNVNVTDQVLSDTFIGFMGQKMFEG